MSKFSLNEKPYNIYLESSETQTNTTFNKKNTGK